MMEGKCVVEELKWVRGVQQQLKAFTFAAAV